MFFHGLSAKCYIFPALPESQIHKAGSAPGASSRHHSHPRLQIASCGTLQSETTRLFLYVPDLLPL